MGYTLVDSSGGTRFSGTCIGCTSVGGGANTGTFGFEVGFGLQTRRKGMVNAVFLPSFHMGFPGGDVSFDIGIVLGMSVD
jgi:hypothetical protein